MQLTLASHGVQEVNTAESTGYAGIDIVASTRDADLGVTTNVREDVALAKLNESQLGVVAVSQEIFGQKLANVARAGSTRRL